MTQVIIDSLGVEVVNRDLHRWGDAAGDVSPAMPAVLDVLRAGERKQFDSQGAYGSGGWAALADSTRARKAGLGMDPRILRATGALFDAMTGHGGAQIAIARHDGADFGTTLNYARFHQQGRGQKKRPVVQPPEYDRRQIVRIVQRHLVDGH